VVVQRVHNAHAFSRRRPRLMGCRRDSRDRKCPRPAPRGPRARRGREPAECYAARPGGCPATAVYTARRRCYRKPHEYETLPQRPADLHWRRIASLPKVTRPRGKFLLQPRRWIVERTSGWLNGSRQLAKIIRAAADRAGDGPLPPGATRPDTTLRGPCRARRTGSSRSRTRNGQRTLGGARPEPRLCTTQRACG
jgi:hypothetical protein